ncbi:MAG: hypothetical protein QGG48_07660, partial [Desulfatiglandales bacterium]|nr:hypothetical protein [Desulfatiglandales bacterium]
MAHSDSPPTEAFWHEDPFRFIRPGEFEALGIDPGDVPLGTFAAQKHPSQLPSRFGGNAYGFGVFEGHSRLETKEIKLLQSLSFGNPDEIKRHYKEINSIYKNIGLLIRFSSHGKPFYLIPIHLVSNSLTDIKDKAAEISKIVSFHRRKYLKESHKIGLLTHTDDLLINDLSIRFREHQFIIIDSLENLRVRNETLDLVILTRDIYEIILMEKFIPRSSGIISKRELDKYAIYLLGKIYKVLKPDGEIFILANRNAAKTSYSTDVTFKTIREGK